MADNPEWRRKRKIVALPDKSVGPEVVLARTLEKATAGHIKSVYIAIEWTDGGFNNDWSTMKTTDMMMHQKVLEYQLNTLWEGS